MNELYQKIVQTTKSRKVTQDESLIISDETEKEMLERHINELFDMICYGFEENLTAAADRGSSWAIICIYRTESLHRGIIPIHDHLIVPEHLAQKLTEYSITSLIDRLKAKFDPFMINIKKLRDLITGVDESRDNVYCVMLEWTALDE